MSIGVIVLLVACVYVIVFGIIIKSLTHTSVKSEKIHFAIYAFGVVLFFIAYLIIIPTPKAGNDRWFNSVLFLRLFWKTFGSLFATAASFIITMCIGAGIGSIFNKEEKLSKKKRQLGWKSLDKEEAMIAFEELYSFEIKKVKKAIDSLNITNAHEGYYGRHNNKMEQVAKSAPLADIRIAAIKKLRNKNQLESCLNYERDENVRKAIEIEISKK